MASSRNLKLEGYKSSQKRESDLVRLKKVRTFVHNIIEIASSELSEHEEQQNEIKKFESRPYQLEAWDALWKAREDGADRGLIHLATGLGKTSIAVFDYAKFRAEQEAKGETARALFVVHQNAILDQADERFNEVLPHLLPGIGMSRFTNQAGGLPISEVIFASFQSLNRGVHRFTPDYFDYIVYDEAHHIEAKTFKRVVEYFTPKFQLGLTATPERSDEKDITEHFGKALYTKTLPEGIAEGYLADIHYRLMLDEQTSQLLQSGFKPKNMAELNRIFDFEPDLVDIANAIKTTQQEIREATGTDKIKTIIFSSDLLVADEMANLINGESYHSGHNNKERKLVLEAFRNGGLETIVTRDMFNEGVDIPDAQLIVFFRSTQSKTIFEQQLGRGLRKADGKDEVTVLDFVANAERIRLLRELAGEVHGKRSGNKNISNSRGHGLKIGAGKSDFEFDQQLIDILDLYDVIRSRIDDRIDWSNWSDNDLVQLALSISPNEALTVKRMDELSDLNEFPYARLIHYRFGSVADFQLACGFELKSWADHTDEELVQLALSLSPDVPISASQMKEYPSDVFPSPSTIINRFGSLGNFHTLCGFEINRWSDMTDQEIIELSFEISRDKPISKSMLSGIGRDRFPGVDFINRRFGNMTNFNKERGFLKTDWSEITKDEIISLALLISPDKPMTHQIITNMSRSDFPGVDILYERFGSLRKFQEACGWTIDVNWQKYSNEELVTLAKELFTDKKFVIESYEKGYFPGVDALIRRFGTLDDFRRACGFEVKASWTEASNDEIIQVAKLLSPDTPLSQKKIESLSASSKFPSTSFIYKRFGSLIDFQRACGFEVKDKPDWSKYSKSDLINLAHDVFPEGPVSQKDINSIDRAIFPSKTTIQHLFGSITEFNQACGFID